MEREGEGAPVEAEPPVPGGIAVADAVDRSTRGASPVAIFFGILAMLLASFGGTAIVLGGAGRGTSSDPTPTPALTPAAQRTAPPAAAATTATGSDRVRVTSANGRSRAIAGGTQHEITFTWTLEGAREGDEAVLQFYAGTRALGQQRGRLDPTVFNFSTGTLSLTVAMDCSSGGWTAEIVTVRGQPVEGSGEAAAPGVQCR